VSQAAQQPDPVPEPPRPEQTDLITLEEIQQEPLLSTFIASADRVMEGLGYTEHGFRHANLSGRIAFNVMAAQVNASQRLLRDFVANVSHELKTPLTSIRMFAEMMQGGNVAAEKRPQYLRIIVAEAERRFPGDVLMAQRVSIIAGDQVRMTNLAMAGSHSVNGVAELHSRLVTTTLAPDFFRLYPSRFNNKTNGVTPRRWLLHANRPLAALVTKSNATAARVGAEGM